MPTLSIIVITTGKPSLFRTLASLTRQLALEDEVLVVGMSPLTAVRKLVYQFGHQFRYLELSDPSGGMHAQRLLGMSEAVGDYLSFISDEDIYFPGALDVMKKAVEKHSESLLLFRMISSDRLIWETPEIECGNIKPQMMLIKNAPLKAADWEMSNAEEYLFVQETVHLYPPEKVRFEEETVIEEG